MQSMVEGGPCQVMSPLRQPCELPPPRPGEDIDDPTHATAEPVEARPIAPDEFPPTPAQSTTLRRVVIGLDPPPPPAATAAASSSAARTKMASLTSSPIAPPAASAPKPGPPRRRSRDDVRREPHRRREEPGDMIASVLHAVDADLPVKLVAATRSKAARAEPIALRFETGRARLAGHFPELEDQLCALTWAGYMGAGSPDRLDAMVWAMTELFEKERAVPRVRAL